MQSALLISILIIALIILAIQLGIAKAQKIEAQRAARLGAEIDKIVARNANIDKHDWITWLQERSSKQK